jgi:branched-chain amino acid transport system permease protein
VTRRPAAAPLCIVLAGALLAVLPWLGAPAFYDSLLYLGLHWIVLATSWNILSGYAGYFSFGHGAFLGAGVYTTATLSGKLDWPFLATLPLAAAVAALLGLALGAVVFRVRGVRGELFALLTLAVTFVLATIILNTPIDGGPGIYLNAVAVPALAPTQSGSLYLLALAAAVLTLLVAWAIAASKLGLGLFALHDDEDAAEVMGVPTYRYKLVAFAISCALAGLAGGIHALFISYVTTSEVFSITVPLTVVLMAVLGGTRHWAGPAVGAVAITGLLYYATDGDHAVLGKAAVGGILVVAILFMPDGVRGRWSRRRRGGPVPLERASTAAGLDGAAAPVSSAAPGTVLLRARDLSKSFRGLRALDGVDVDIRAGEIVGLLGPNGSGKSTFINVVSGHYTPSGGELTLDGRSIARLPAHRIARAGVARTYQIPRPFAHLSVLDNVAVTATFGGIVRTRGEAVAEAMRWLRFTGLADKADARPDELNLHQRKFLELARALAAGPRLVLLDEVLCGLTPAEMDEAVALVRRIRDQGPAVLIVEHVMRAVTALADRVIVFNEGVLLAQGSAADVMCDPAVVTAYLGRPHA